MSGVAFEAPSTEPARPLVYLLRCKDGSLYCGWTKRLPHRLLQHNGVLAGGAKYTRPRRPVTLVWTRGCETESDAKRLEARIKRMTRREKLAVVEGRMEP